MTTYASDSSSAPVSFYGTLNGPLICTMDCGNCCTGQTVTEQNHGFTASIGEQDVTLEKYFGDGVNHHIQGYFYQGSGSCGMNSCTFFKVLDIDSSNDTGSTNNDALYNSITGELYIPSLRLEETKRYMLSLNAPYNLKSFSQIMQQGEDCSGDYKHCDTGLSCLSYFGIAGSNGPEFQSCEITCKDDSACPGGQSCITIADGPGQVCR